MAVYEVFVQQVSYRYKTTVCSKASVVFVISALFAAIMPLVISYRSNGFWLKSDIYQEQPEVRFAHDYLLVLQTNFPENPIQCRARFSLADDVQRHCLFKSVEEDSNHDGKVDLLIVHVKVPLLRNESVYSVLIILPLDFYISNVCRMRMKSLALVQYSAALPGASLDVAADLRFLQKKPVDYRSAEFIFSSTLLSEDTNLRDILFAYSQRNYSTNLMNQYSLWTSGRDIDSPFFITLKISIPESSIVYRPGFWQVIKWAWIQYLSLLIVFLHIFNALKEYVFSNQLVPTYKYIPWKQSN